jgi:Dna[CI] antecedent DciA-like protein
MREIRHHFGCRVEKYRNINVLFEGSSERLTSLRARSHERSQTLAHVVAALPPKLAQTVATAGIEHGRLTIGVSGGAWASRLRYVTEMLRRRVSDATGIEIRTVRIKVVHPAP